jgi:hypothetical protein
MTTSARSARSARAVPPQAAAPPELAPAALVELASAPLDRVAATTALATGVVFKFSDLGTLLGIGQRTLEDMAAQGTGPQMFRIGRQRYVHRIQLHRWLRKLADDAEATP